MAPVIDEKLIDRQNNKTPTKQLTRMLYICIYVLCAVCSFVFGLWRMEVKGRASDNSSSNQKLVDCAERGEKREKDFRAEWKADIQQAQNIVIAKTLPPAETRKKRGAIFKEKYSRIIPNQLENARKAEAVNEQLKKLNKHRQP